MKRPYPPRLQGLGLLRHVLSFEVIFALHTHAMFWKSSPLAQSSPIDVTPLTGSLSALAAAWLCISGQVRLPLNSLRVPAGFLALGVWALISLLWTRNPVDGPYKVAYMLTLSLWCVQGGTMIGLDRARLSRYAWTVIVLGIVLTLDFAATPGIDSWLHPPTVMLRCPGAAVGLLAGCSLVCVWMLLLVCPAVALRSRVLGAGIAVLLSLPLLRTGQRGPVLFLCILPMLTLAMAWRNGRAGPAILALATLAGTAAVAYAFAEDPSALSGYGTFSRMQTLQETQYGGRVDLFAMALDLWRQRPWIGQGVAGFTVPTHGASYEYPHNIILEALCELGIVGFLLLGFTLWSAAIQLLSSSRRWVDQHWVMVLALSSYTLLLSMKSGDLVGARWMWAAVGMTSVGLPFTSLGAQICGPSSRPHRGRPGRDTPAAGGAIRS